MLNIIYRTLTDIGSPLIRLYLDKRRRQGREDAARFHERLGQAVVARPMGKLVWCHAASVGEAASLLAVIAAVRAQNPALNVLVTTGTVTSARMLADRLPAGVIHQYIPVDRIPYVRGFLNHWQPDLAVWIESELWPNMLAEIKARNIPAVLLNGRMSENSFHNWRYVGGWARDILSTFSLCLAQTSGEVLRFSALGAKNVRSVGNLKYAAKQLPYDEGALAQLTQSIGNRPCWVAASTHPGEEEIVLATHRALLKNYPDLLTIIVPRHAVRGDEIAQLLAQANIETARRSAGAPITATTQIYLADTMGELGLFYRLCPIVVMGGSLQPVGGHNPIEPAQLDTAIIFGPHMKNFAEMAGEFMNVGAALRLQNTDDLAPTLQMLFADPAKKSRLAQAARLLADDKRLVLDRVMQELKPFLARVA